MKYPKESSNIWASIVRKFVAKNFQKLPNLVTLLVTEKEVNRNGKSLNKTVLDFIFKGLQQEFFHEFAGRRCHKNILA